jgi:hypothetical protein
MNVYRIADDRRSQTEHDRFQLCPLADFCQVAAAVLPRQKWSCQKRQAGAGVTPHNTVSNIARQMLIARDDAFGHSPCP